MTKFSSALPAGDANGLTSLSNKLIRNPKGTHIIVGVIDVKSITTDIDSGDQVATVRFRRVEAIHEEDADHALRMLARGVERRTGATMLPIEIEDELQALTDSLDWTTGELLDPDGDGGNSGDKVPLTVTDANPDVDPSILAHGDEDSIPAVPAEAPAKPEPAKEPAPEEKPAEEPAPEPAPAPKKTRAPRKKAEPKPRPADTEPDFTVPDDLSGMFGDNEEREAS